MWHDHELVSVRCDYCSSIDSRIVFVRPDGLNVVECQLCGLAYINPRPRSDLLSRFYDREYFFKTSICSNGSVGYYQYGQASPPETSLANYELDVIECQRSLVGARLLDVGCATGQLLKKAMIRGALSTGIDISPQAVDEARHHGLEARVGTIESEDRNGCYDIVTAFEVIEHVENPVSFLKNAYRNLSPGGLMAITTPNYANSFIHGEKWIGFQMSMEHLYYFSDEVLTRMAQKAGFRLVDIRTLGDGVANSSAPNPVLIHLRHLAGQIPFFSEWVREYRRLHRISPWKFTREGHRIMAVFMKY